MSTFSCMAGSSVLYAEHALSWIALEHCVLPPQYKDQLEALKAKAEEDMDAVKRKDGLDYIESRPEELKLAPL